jgi:hypothetical protein
LDLPDVEAAIQIAKKLVAWTRHPVIIRDDTGAPIATFNPVSTFDKPSEH